MVSRNITKDTVFSLYCLPVSLFRFLLRQNFLRPRPTGKYLAMSTLRWTLKSVGLRLDLWYADTDQTSAQFGPCTFDTDIIQVMSQARWIVVPFTALNTVSPCLRNGRHPAAHWQGNNMKQYMLKHMGTVHGCTVVQYLFLRFRLDIWFTWALMCWIPYHIHDYPSRVPNLSLSGICSLLSRVWWCPSIKSSLAVASWSSRLGSSSGGSSTSSPSSSLVWGDFFSACWPNKRVDWQTSKNNKKYVSKYTHIG